MIIRNRLVEIEKRCSEARPGPWISWIEGRDHEGGSNFIQVGVADYRGEDIELIGATKADQDFIAAARQDVADLTAEIRRLHSQLGEEW